MDLKGRTVLIDTVHLQTVTFNAEVTLYLKSFYVELYLILYYFIVTVVRLFGLSHIGSFHYAGLIFEKYA